MLRSGRGAAECACARRRLGPAGVPGCGGDGAPRSQKRRLVEHSGFGGAHLGLLGLLAVTPPLTSFSSKLPEGGQTGCKKATPTPGEGSRQNLSRTRT